MRLTVKTCFTTYIDSLYIQLSFSLHILLRIVLLHFAVDLGCIGVVPVQCRKSSSSNNKNQVKIPLIENKLIDMTRSVLRHLVIMTSLLNPAFAALRHDVGLRQSDASDVIFTQNLLWTTMCTTRTQCAVNCMYDNLCVTYTVSPSPESGEPRFQFRHNFSSDSFANNWTPT